MTHDENYYKARFKFDKDRTKVWRAICEFIQKKFVSENATILELGAGYCDFINNIQGQKKYALDIDKNAEQYKSEEVTFFCQSTTDPLNLEQDEIDFVFASNLFEHLDNDQLDATMKNLGKHLKKGGKIALMQPNYKYCAADYFDDYTHVKVFSHVSLSDFLVSHGYEIEKCIPRFVPFSMKSRLPKSYFLTKLFVNSPIRPTAKQMLVVAKKV